MRRLPASYLLPQWPRMTLLGALSTAGIGLDVLNPQVMRSFVDGALAADALPSLLNLGGLYLAIALASQLVSVVEAYVAEVAAWTATNELRADLNPSPIGARSRLLPPAPSRRADRSRRW